MERVLFSGGSVVTAEGVIRADVAVSGGKISEIGDNLPTSGARVIDAGDCYVMPGGVDARTRITQAFNSRQTLEEQRELWRTASMAAAYGGTTCIVEAPAEMPNGNVPVAEVAADNSAVDYAVYSVATPEGNIPPGGVPALCPMSGERGLDDAALLRALHTLKSSGGLAHVRCANDAMLAWCRRQLQEANACDVRHIPSAYPTLNEEEGVWRLMALAQTAGAAVSVVNLSTASAAFMVRMARTHGHKIFAETCPQYLLLDASCYEEGVAEGLKYLTMPPLRAKTDQTGLWQCLRDGHVDIVTSDHCGGSFAARWEASQGDIFASPLGLPGVETRVPLIFSEGVLKGRVPLPRFVEIMATRPADMLGLPHKGRIAVGADADIMVLNPQEARDVTAQLLHQGTDYTPYEGMKVRGWPQHVFLRGQQLVDNYAFVGEGVSGQQCTVTPLEW